MPENLILGNLATEKGKVVLKDYLLRLAEGIEVIYTETAPNGNLSAVRGKICIYKNGSTYEQWQNMDGATLWQRIDNGLSVPLTYIDTDGTLAANSDTKIASQKATKTYADTKVISPATNTANSVPQWNGANSKTLKDGLVVGTAANNLLQLNGSAQIPAVDGSLITGIPGNYAAGDLLVASANTERSTTSAAYVKVKEISLDKGGTLRIKFDGYRTGGLDAYTRIYRNGVAVGTEQAISVGAYATISEDISGWSTGDLVQLYYKAPATVTNYVKNFKLYATGSLVVNTD